MIVNNKIDMFLPILQSNGKYYVNFNLTENESNPEYATWESISFKHKPQLFEIKNAINNFYNSKCQEDIANGLIWKDLEVKLSSENQQNYKRHYDLAYQTNGSNLPLTVKLYKNGQGEYYTFTTVEDITNFYLAIDKHINTCLNNCWSAKESVNWSDYEL